MRVEVSDEAAAFVSANGGTVWVWAHRPPMCCNGTPAGLRASIAPPPDPSGFEPMAANGVDVRFRAPGGRCPDVLEVGLHGRRRPRVEAYWDGCLIVM
jgi:hypothetical protein